MKTIHKKNTDALEKSNLIQILKSFSIEEMKEFAKFANMPFFNKRSDVSKYITVLKRFHPSFEGKDCTKEKIHSKIYPGKKYEDINIRRINSYSLKIAEEYLFVLYGRRNAIIKNDYLAEEYINRSLNKPARAKIKEYENELSMNTMELHDYFRHRANLNDKLSKLARLENMHQEYNEYIMKSGDDMLAGMFIVLAKTYVPLVMGKELFNIDLKNTLIHHFLNSTDFSEMFNFAKKNNHINFPYLYTQYLTVKCINETDNYSYYEQFAEFVDKHEDKFFHDTLLDFVFFSYNYLLMRQKKLHSPEGAKVLYHHLKEVLRKKRLKRTYEHYIIDGYGMLLGATDMAYTFGDTEFLVFIQKEYLKQVHPDVRYLTGQFMSLMEHYLKKNYSKALEIINSTQIDHYLFYQRFRYAEVQIHFDIGDYERVIYLVDSFKHFYNKKYTQPRVFEITMKFLNILNKLAKMAPAFPVKELELLKMSLTQLNSFTMEKWLNERITKLERTNKRL